MKDRVQITITLLPTNTKLPYWITKETKTLLDACVHDDIFVEELETRLTAETGSKDRAKRIIRYYIPTEPPFYPNSYCTDNFLYAFMAGYPYAKLFK